MDYTIKFTAQDLQVLVNVLTETPLPFKVSNPLLQKIQQQVNQQTTPDKTPESDTNE